MSVKLTLAAAGVLMAVTATGASAQAVINLSGEFQCVQGCVPGYAGQTAYVTQTEWQINLVNEAGDPSRAWVDYPGHIWAQNWNEGAVYSSDGMTIQFDRGKVWQRIVEAPPPPAPPPPPVRHHKKPPPPLPAPNS